MIKKRNLDNSLIQWIMTVTGLGPGIGEIKYLVPAASSTSQYRTQLQSMGVTNGDMFTTPAAAYAPLESYRNDVLLVMPAPSHLMTAAVTWAKHNTHMIGLAGPNNRCDWTTGIRFRTATEAIGALFDVTGHSVQFHNVGITNHGNYNTNYAALNVTGHSFYAKGVQLRGAREATQAAAADCCSLKITSGSASAEHARFDDCIIGYPKNPSHSGPTIYFVGNNANPATGVEFHNCRIMDQINTSATTGLVQFDTGTNLDRNLYFDRCLFYNFNTNWTAQHARVFHFENPAPSTRDIILHDCIAKGFAEWTTNDTGTMVSGNMANAGSSGGLAAELTSD